MYTYIRAALHGEWLHELHPDIVIQKINEDAPQMDTTTAQVGQRTILIGRRRDTLSVSIVFTIRNHIRDYRGRAEILSLVNAWAMQDGDLAVSYRPDQVLHVHCTDLPAAGAMDDWTTEYAITFTAYAVPHWEDESVSSWTYISTTRATAAIDVPGNARTPLCLSATSTASGAITWLEVATGGQLIRFEGISMSRGDRLVIRYADSGLQELLIIRASGAGESVIGKRTTDSADELLLHPGVT